MTVRREKKSRSHRGSRHCGWGIRGHRGSGRRAGFGNAGSGKRSDAKKPIYDRIEDYFGKHGFIARGRTKAPVCTLNLKDLEMSLAAFKAAGVATEHGGVVEVNLDKAGVDKLLGTGKVTKKMKVTVASASARVREAIEAAGGELHTESE